METATVIGRLRELMRREGLSQAALAKRIGINPANLSKHLNGHLPVTDSLINRVVVEMNVSKDWIRGLSDDPSPAPVAAFNRGTPVYDIDVTAGFSELSRQFTDDRIIGYINLPQLSNDCAVVRVSGDSMVPVVNPDSLVAISRSDSRNSIFWGQIYVVVLDDYRMVKFLRRHAADESKVILHSANPAYDDMIVDRSAIRSLYLVETVVNISRRY